MAALFSFLVWPPHHAYAAKQQIALATGWNLISLQIGTESSGFTITEIRAGLDRTNVMDFVCAYDPVQRTYTSYQSITNYPPAIGELKAIEPGRGYWVYGGEAVSLAPAPALILAPDTDNAPLAQATLYVGANPVYQGRMVTLAGSEDFASDLNANGILDDPYTQNTMLFDEGVNTQNITILNTNSSLLNWSITTATPWLSFSPTDGTTATESDHVAVLVNRNGLTSGTPTGSYTVDFAHSFAVNLVGQTLTGFTSGQTVNLRVKTANAAGKTYSAAKTVMIP